MTSRPLPPDPLNVAADSAVSTLLKELPAEPLTTYVMARVADYDAPFYDRALEWLGRHVPTAHIVPARGLWPTTTHWLAGWPQFSTSVGLGVVVTNPSGTIGRGVWSETEELAARSVPVLWLRQCGDEMTPVARFALLRLPGDRWTAWGQVVPLNEAASESTP